MSPHLKKKIFVDDDLGFELNFHKSGVIKTESRRNFGYINGKQMLVNIGEAVLGKEKVAR